MTTLGLVESKQSFAVPAVADLLADPDADGDQVEMIVVNPGVSMDAIYKAWSDTYVQAQNQYKYLLAGKRLQLGSGMSIESNFLTFKWILYTLLDGAKQIHKRVKHRAIAFVQPSAQDAGDIAISLRTRSNSTLLQDFLGLVAAAGVDISPLRASDADHDHGNGNGDGDAEAAAAEAEAQRLLKQAEQEALQKAEQELALALTKPLSFRAPQPFEPRKFTANNSFFLGEVDDNDLTCKLYDEKTAGCKASAEAPGAGQTQREPTAEEWNAQGKAIYARDALHEQIFTFYEQVVANFPALVCVVAQKGEAPVLHPTVYCVNDVQYAFEHDFANIASIGEALLHVFPLINVVDGAALQDLWVQNASTGEFCNIVNPVNFSVMGHFMDKAEFGYILHKSRPNLAEGNEPRVERQIAESFEQFFAKLHNIIQGWREQRKLNPVPVSSSSASSDFKAGCGTESCAFVRSKVSSNTVASAPAPPAHNTMAVDDTEDESDEEASTQQDDDDEDLF